MRTRLLIPLLMLALGSSAAQQGPAPPTYQNQALSYDERVNDLVGRMTLEEKAAQLVNTAPAIPRLGVPAYDYWNEGLHGSARSGYSTLFPQAIGNAATFDEPLLGQIGEVVSTEARAKFNEAVRHDVHSIYYGLTVWSPNINIFRDPRWGRGQETYGEDPFLTARLGTSFIKGLQGTDPKYYRVIATPKHFAVHSGPEATRHSDNVEPSPHDLWDTYLPAFRSTVVEGKAGSIMCAYNAVDGKPACASDLLLKDTLRRDWHFQGFVTSDCGAIEDFLPRDMSYGSGKAAHNVVKTEAEATALGIRTGTDTNCGDTYLAMPKAVRQGLLKEAEVDTALRRLFLARFRLGLFDDPAKVRYAAVPFSEVNSPAHAALALQAARESIVLLKNTKGTLPLNPATVKTVAVIGPGANDLFALTGNYYAIPKNPQMPVDGIARQTRVIYAQGAPYADGLNMVVPRSALLAAPAAALNASHGSQPPAQQGLLGHYFANDHFGGRELQRYDKEISFDWNGGKPLPAIPAEAFSVRWQGSISVPKPGDYTYTVRLAECYPCRDFESVKVTIDGEVKLDSTNDASNKDGRSRDTAPFTVHFAKTTRYHDIVIEYVHRARLFGAGLTLQWTPPAAVLREEAVTAVNEADAIIAFVGLNPNLEGEEMPIHVPGFSGGDRTDIALPAAQQQMLQALKKTGKPLVVVLMNGSALAANWAKENADAILEAWYPGEAGAQAIGETLVGKNNPAGRLPVTFYADVKDLPAFSDYSMANRTYRYYKGKPLYGFGYGLSYTSFAYSNVKVSNDHLQAGDALTVTADVRNTGVLAGDEVAEVYLTPPQDGVSPVYSLEGFQRLHLLPGETKHLSFTLAPRQLSQVDRKGTRAVRAGSYHVNVGGGQPAESDSGAVNFTITGMQELPH